MLHDEELRTRRTACTAGTSFLLAATYICSLWPVQAWSPTQPAGSIAVLMLCCTFHRHTLLAPQAKHVADNEPGCLCYELSICDEDPDKFIIFERWVGGCKSQMPS